MYRGFMKRIISIEQKNERERIRSIEEQKRIKQYKENKNDIQE